MTGRNADFETKINLTDFLPSGLKLTSGTSGTLIVKTEILPVGSKSYSISTRDITVKNAPSGLEVVFETDRIEIRVRENGNTLDNLNLSDIKASIDLSGKKEGSYKISVQITLPEGYTLVNEISTDVKLSEATEVTSQAE